MYLSNDLINIITDYIYIFNIFLKKKILHKELFSIKKNKFYKYTKSNIYDKYSFNILEIYIDNICNHTIFENNFTNIIITNDMILKNNVLIKYDDDDYIDNSDD